MLLARHNGLLFLFLFISLMLLLLSMISTSAVTSLILLLLLLILFFLFLSIFIHSGLFQMGTYIVEFATILTSRLRPFTCQSVSISNSFLTWHSFSHSFRTMPCLLNDILFIVRVYLRLNLINNIRLDNSCIGLINDVLSLHGILPSQKLIICR